MDTVTVSVSGSIATITIDRPDSMNALNSATRQNLISAFSEVKQNDDVRVIVLTGAGDRVFSAGQDINESQQFSGEDAHGWMDEWEALYGEIIETDVPTVAKMNGDAVGAAFQIALLCDLRVATADVNVGMTELNIGIPCITGSWIVERVSSYAAAAELTLTGELIGAERAKELELVHRIVPQAELDDEVAELTENLSEKPPISMKYQKEWLRDIFGMDEFSSMMKRGDEIHSSVYESGEPEAYMSEFLE